MVINILLVIVIFGLPKKKFSALAVAGIYGLLKGAICFVASRNLVTTAIGLVIGFALAYATRYLFGRLDNYDKGGEEYSDYSPKKKGKFKWEYIPLAIFVILMIFGF